MRALGADGIRGPAYPCDCQGYIMAFFCILSWPVLWLTMLNPIARDASPKLALTNIEIALLDRLISRVGHRRAGIIAFYLTKLARLSGYLPRTSDPPPENVAIWRGLSRLTYTTRRPNRIG